MQLLPERNSQRPGGGAVVFHNYHVESLTPVYPQFTAKEGGARGKEWKAVHTSGGKGELAVRPHQGEAVCQIEREFFDGTPREFFDRNLPNSWHGKWKDMGEEHSRFGSSYSTPLPQRQEFQDEEIIGYELDTMHSVQTIRAPKQAPVY